MTVNLKVGEEMKNDVVTSTQQCLTLFLFTKVSKLLMLVKQS